MTVKTQGGKAITKGGKVSCSCCAGPPGECCMYPASAYLDGLYGWDDLPDELDKGEIGEPPSYTLEKQPNGTIDEFDGAERIYFKNLGGELFRVTALAPAPSFAIDQTPIRGWQLQIYIGSNEWGWTNGDVLGQECLIGPQQGARLIDKFADTYTVSGPVGGIVTRESLCVWRGAGLLLRYDSRVDFNSQFGYTGTLKWRLNGNNKSGFQNTPVGTYAGGFSVS